MTRRRVLTDEQWALIGKRLLEGACTTDLANEYGVAESTIRSHFERAGMKPDMVQRVAAHLFEADCELRALPTEGQVQALTLFQRLRNISESLAQAAENGAKTAVRFTALANTEAQKVDDADPLGSEKNLKAAVLLTKAANEAASIPLNLLSANRDSVKRLSEDPDAGASGDDELTPERLKSGVRRIAFALQRAAANTTKENA
jgi:hypothetical protein